jgi:hypothetical protein
VVDKTGDVARRRVDPLRQLAERRVAAAHQPEHHREAARAQAVLLCPTLLEVEERPRRHAERRQGFNRGRVDVERPHQGAERLVVELAVVVAGEL